MTSLLHFEEKVHRKGLAQAESLLLLMPRLLSQVLEHLAFPEESRIERRISCTQILSTERSLYTPISIILQQQEQVEAADDLAEDPLRVEDPVPEMEVEVERSPAPDSSPPSPPPTVPAPADTVGPSYSAQQSQSIFMSVLGSLLLLWMLSARLLLHRRRWTSGWLESRSL